MRPASPLRPEAASLICLFSFVDPEEDCSMLILHLQSLESLEDECPEGVAETVQPCVSRAPELVRGKFYDVEGRSGEGDDKFVKAGMWPIRACPILAKIAVLGQ